MEYDSDFSKVSFSRLNIEFKITGVTAGMVGKSMHEDIIQTAKYKKKTIREFY